ncbi:hypothetical protein [Paraburkholderia sp. BCC1884]|uniref:hypothetical protein n=1 Tax=Paraburkholderia sp. BCC1884 TaxID=2562668 RepID=UPI0016424308|nr:hypothetical protein [Paraburkholderia sp. BCC1884]
MTQSMIYIVVGLVVLLVAAFMVAQQFRRDYPEERMTQWLDSHNMSWLHRHKH